MLALGDEHSCVVRNNGSVQCWGENIDGQIAGTAGADAPLPVAVPSFTLNINPVSVLQDKPRQVTVNIIATCEEGRQLQVSVVLTQGSVKGFGSGHSECTNALTTFPVTVHAQGSFVFAVGPARVEAYAIIAGRGGADLEEWTRNVEIINVP
jgi:hypothetical protein